VTRRLVNGLYRLQDEEQVEATHTDGSGPTVTFDPAYPGQLRRIVGISLPEAETDQRFARLRTSYRQPVALALLVGAWLGWIIRALFRG
jgi:hypothetical protein